MFPDDDMYALSGWQYVNGQSPDDPLNLAHPPLAKYLIGFSELIFMNQAMIGLIVSVLTLILVYLISKKFITVFPFALLPSLILSLDKLYVRFSSVSMLDIYPTFFAALSVFLLLTNKRKWLTPMVYVAIGLAISCKWTAAFLLFLPPLYYAAMGQRRNLKLFPLYLVITIVTYTSTYIVFLITRSNLLELLFLQFTMFRIHQGNRLQMGTPPPFWILLNFLTGIEGPTLIQTIWINPTSAGEGVQNLIITTSNPERGLSLVDTYNPLTWPLSFSASILTLYYSLKEDRRILPVPLAFLVLLSGVSVGKIFIWYLLPGLPFAFVSLTYMISRVYSEVSRKTAPRIVMAVYVALIVVWSLFVKIPQFIRT